MYLFNLKIFFSKSCFKFVKSFIATFNAVNLGCLLKGLEIDLSGLFTNTRMRWQHNEREILLMREAKRVWICKQTIHSH